MGIDWEQFKLIVGQHQHFLLTSHIRPDCDALGSELGMAGILESLGKQVLIVNGQATPPNLAFIDPSSKIRVIGEDVTADDLKGVEVLMVLDTSAWAQLGPMGEVLRGTEAKKVVFDHHVSEDDLGAIALKDTQAEATGRLVAQAAEHLGVEITPELAMPLYAAIATDTGWFRFGSTTNTTMRVAGNLIEAGADPTKIFADLYEQDTIGRVKLRGRVLERFATELAGRLIHTYVLADDFAQTGALPSDTEDVINMGFGVSGTEFAVILVGQQTGGFKISFRSRCDAAANQLAEQFGGGGHRAAAGAFIEESFEIAQSRVLDAVRSAMQ